MNNITITFHSAINGAYVEFFADVPDNEVERLIESRRCLNPDGTSHETPEGLKPFNNIRWVTVNKYGND
jgi:hypothetical protein